MKNKPLLLLLLFPLVTGCSLLDFDDTTPKEPEGGETEPGGGGKTDPAEQGEGGETDPSDPEDPVEEEYVPKASTNKTFLEFFEPDSKVEIELDFTNESITHLRDYADGHSGNANFEQNEMYHPCTAKIVINGKETVFEECGARMRGNTSRNLNFVNNEGYFDINNLCHFKLNFSQTFDDPTFYYFHDWTGDEEGYQERDDRKLGGMKKIDLKWNKNLDNTFTKEGYVLDVFWSEGVLAQHSTLVKLTVMSENDSYTEVYQALEAIDKRLLKAADDNDNKGDLYKCLYTGQGSAHLRGYEDYQIGVEAQDYLPTYSLKTNEKDNDFSSMKNLITTVNKSQNGDGVTPDQYFESVSEIINVDNFLKYSALCWVFGLPDDLRNNYNNYYVYISKNRKALFIPYDNDRCLGILQDWPMDLKNKAMDDPYDVNGNFNQCPLVLRLVTGGSNNTYTVHQESKNKYMEYCKEYALKYLDVSKFQEYTNHFYYAPSEDISIGGGQNETFATYATAKLGTLN